MTDTLPSPDGTNPADTNSAKYFLTVNANFGTVTKSPDLPKYDRGTSVTLTPTPNAGLIFTGWTGSETGTADPLQFAITANESITAHFGVSLPVALDSPLTFTTGGDGTWMGQVVTSLDGEDAAQSAPIGHSQQAWMETTVNGPGELADAATALDWLQAYNTDAQTCWIAGVSFGAWIAMQLLMRRPEIDGFISVAPPANLYDFTFLAPCPSSGLMVNGAKDRVVPTESVRGLVDRLKTQKGIVIDHATVPDANHFFEGRMDGLMEVVDAYLDKRLGKPKRRKESAA